MAGKSDGQSILENAYQLHTPDDNRTYYDAFAETYDTDFVEAMGYSYPATVAGICRREAIAEDVPVADIGCGTGIVAEAQQLSAHGFGDVLSAMMTDGLIRGLKSDRRPIYDKQGHDHSGDHALIQQFRKA